MCFSMKSTAIVSCLLLCFVGCDHRGTARVQFSDSPAESLRITFFDRETPREVEITSHAKIEELLNLFQRGLDNEDHKCGDAAHLKILHTDGTSTELSVLPGHDPDHYEFRYQRKNYRVTRAEVLDVFEAMGIDPQRLTQGP